MTNDLLKARSLLDTGNYTCVVCREDRVHTATDRGVKPLLNWLESGLDLQHFSAADRVVGRATAFLYVLLGVKEVYAHVMSRPAAEVLAAHGITAHPGKLVDGIINRKGDGPCPFEAAVLEITDPREALIAIRRKRAQMAAFVETPRLLLRKVTEEDYPYFRTYLMDKEMDRLMLRSACSTEADARLGFEWFLYKEARAYAIVHKETGRTVGNLTVYDRIPDNIAAQAALRGKTGRSLSFAMSPAFQRRGFMSEALRAVICHLFREENADYIHCGCLSINTPSKALQEKLGFTPLLTDRFSFDGQEIETLESILWRT